MIPCEHIKLSIAQRLSLTPSGAKHQADLQIAVSVEFSRLYTATSSPAGPLEVGNVDMIGARQLTHLAR
jgi:hypothetical protein